MKFWCDQMLGKLARWLRIMGYDTVYEREGVPLDLYMRSLESNRTFLTRSATFSRKEKAIVLASNAVDEQLVELKKLTGLNLSVNMLKARCGVCNGELIAVKESELTNEFKLAYPKVMARHSEFTRCVSCNKIYWVGTHVERMQTVIDRINSR